MIFDLKLSVRSGSALRFQYSAMGQGVFLQSAAYPTEREALQDITAQIAGEEQPKQPIADKPFDRFWDVCPRRIGKHAANKAYDLAMQRVTRKNGWTKAEGHSFLRERMEAFAQSYAGRKYCPAPAKWLADGRYDDDPDEWRDREKPRVLSPEEFESNPYNPHG